MNQRFRSYALTALVIAALFFGTGCQQHGQIPVNQANVTRHIISIDTARAYTASFRRSKLTLQQQLRDSSFLNSQFQLPIAVQFNRDVLALLLNQKDSAGADASGIRMYFARNNKNEITLVLVPYDGKNNDMIKNLTGKEVVSIPGLNSAYAFPATAGQAADNALRCPTFCDESHSGLGED